jgi:hypothetical protein
MITCRLSTSETRLPSIEDELLDHGSFVVDRNDDRELDPRVEARLDPFRFSRLDLHLQTIIAATDDESNSA